MIRSSKFFCILLASILLAVNFLTACTPIPATVPTLTIIQEATIPPTDIPEYTEQQPTSTQAPTKTQVSTQEPTNTPEPSPTAESAPETCLDQAAEQKVIDTYLTEHGFASLEDAWKAHKEKFTDIQIEYATEQNDNFVSAVRLTHPLVFGSFEFQPEKIENAHGLCLIVGYSQKIDGKEQVRHVPVFLTATKDNKFSVLP
jgi:hypothetical protein